LSDWLSHFSGDKLGQLLFVVFEDFAHVRDEFGPFLNGPFALDGKSLFGFLDFILQLLIAQVIVLVSDLACERVF
jgi:hypothetical protein